MKRVLVVVLALVMMFVCASSIADSNKMEQCKQSLGMSYLAYKLKPEEFTAELIANAYVNFMLYLSLESEDVFLRAYDRENGDTDAIMKTYGVYSRSTAGMMKLATDGYIEWLKGEKTGEQYSDVLMAMVKEITGFSD